MLFGERARMLHFFYFRSFEPFGYHLSNSLKTDMLNTLWSTDDLTDMSKLSGEIYKVCLAIRKQF